MSMFEQFLNNISHKFPKGYPDMNNGQDILIIESELKKLGLEAKIPSSSSSEAIEYLKKNYNLSQDNFDLISSKTFKILLPSNFKLSRTELLSDLQKNPDFKFDNNSIGSGSSIGRLKYKDSIIIYIKFKDKQGQSSPGKRNESSFFTLINRTIQEAGKPIDVILKSSNKSLKFTNIDKCLDSSLTKTRLYLKADTQLISNEEVVANISLKQENAVRWESSKTRLESLYNNFIQKALSGELQDVTLKPIEGAKNKYKMFNPTTSKIIPKVIIKNTPKEIEEDTIFGKDDPKTIIIKQNFENYSDYTFENNTLTVNCKYIYTDVSDIVGTSEEPVFAFSNHIGKAYGIELRSFIKGLLYKEDNTTNYIEVDYNNLV